MCSYPPQINSGRKRRPAEGVCQILRDVLPISAMDVRGLKTISTVPVRCVFSARTSNMKQFAAILSGLSEVFRLKGSGSELWCMCVIHSHSSVFALLLLERWRDVCRDEMNAAICACFYLTRLLFEEALPRSLSPHGGFINVICKIMPFCLGFDL